MMMLFFLFLGAAFSCLPSLHAMSCVQTVNGTTYNLTSLHGLSDLSITPSTGAYAYYINVCGAVQGPCASHPSAFACQVRKSPLQFEAVLGYSDVENHQPAPMWTQSTSTYGGVKLTFTNGDACNLRQRILNIDFQCDINNTRSIEIYEMPQCTFNVIFPTNRTCIDSPSSPSSSSISSSSSFINSSSSTGPSPSNFSSTAGPSNSSSAIPIPTNSSSSIPTNSSTSIPSNSSSSSIPSNSSSTSIPTNSSTSIPSNSSSSSIPSNSSSTSIPSNSSSTAIFSSSTVPSESSGPMPPISSTGHIDSSSTGTIPSKPEEGSTVTITGAGIGIGILIGTSVTSALVLIWCCWDRSRRRSNPALSVNERQYTSLDA